MINEAFSSCCCHSLGNATSNQYSKAGSYLQCLTDSCEVAGCNVLSDKRNKNQNETKSCPIEL